MFFSLSLATYYTLSSLTRNCKTFLGIRRAHYILPRGSFGRRLPLKDQKRKPSSRKFPVEDTSDLICLTSGQNYLRDDSYKNYLDITLQEQQKVFVDFLLKELEDCLRIGVSETLFFNDVDRYHGFKNKKDKSNPFEGDFGTVLLTTDKTNQFEGDFGIVLLTKAPPTQTPPFQQDDNSSVWSDAFGYHTKLSTKVTFQGFTVTCETYTFVSFSGSQQIEDNTETLSDPTGTKWALKAVHKWTDGRSSYLKQTKLMHSYIQDKEFYSSEEDLKQFEYSAVFGLTSERTENNTVYTVVEGPVTTSDQTFARTQTTNDGITTVTNTNSGSQRTITDDKTTWINNEEVESSTNGLSTSGSKFSYKSFQSEDVFQYHTFSRITNRDGSSTWNSSEAILRPKDSFFVFKNVFPMEEGVDIPMTDEAHRYLQF